MADDDGAPGLVVSDCRDTDQPLHVLLRDGAADNPHLAHTLGKLVSRARDPEQDAAVVSRFGSS
jgi:hypothetical protein